MLDLETTVLLRTVLDEVCGGAGKYENGVRAHVASMLLEAAARGPQTADELRETGRRALKGVPTMWR
jgi:hypothetical protein